MEETEERSYTGTEKSRYKSILEQIAGDMGGGMPKMDGKGPKGEKPDMDGDKPKRDKPDMDEKKPKGDRPAPDGEKPKGDMPDLQWH